MPEPRPHSHEDRARIVSQLADLHRAELGANLVGLATQGSFARNEDLAYSDLELVAFLQELPAVAERVDGEQIFDGMFVDLVWTTEANYIANVKEVTPAWYIAGSDRLGPVMNEPLIVRINGYRPQNLRARCLEQAVNRWPALHEATTKVLNALARNDAPDLGRLFFSVLDHVLVVLAFPEREALHVDVDVAGGGAAAPAATAGPGRARGDRGRRGVCRSTSWFVGGQVGAGRVAGNARGGRGDARGRRADIAASGSTELTHQTRRCGSRQARSYADLGRRAVLSCRARGIDPA